MIFLAIVNAVSIGFLYWGCGFIIRRSPFRYWQWDVITYNARDCISYILPETLSRWALPSGVEICRVVSGQFGHVFVSLSPICACIDGLF